MSVRQHFPGGHDVFVTPLANTILTQATSARLDQLDPEWRNKRRSKACEAVFKELEAAARSAWNRGDCLESY